MTATAPALPRRARRPVASPESGGGAIVVGGDYRGLGVVRSLGRRGIPVWVVAEPGDGLATFSRYAARTIRVERSASVELIAVLSDLAALEGLRGWVVIPTGDETAATLSRYRHLLAGDLFPAVPEWDVFRRLYDKRLSYELAQEAGVDMPWTAYPRDLREVEALDAPFPVILKPAVKPEFNRLTAAKAWRVEDRRELLDRYREAGELVPPGTLMVQEVVPGGGETQLSYAALCDEGRVVAAAVARRTRQYPADFGRASTYVETIDVPEVEEPATRLLGAARVTGLAEVEFKRDPRTGRLLLLDVNPRVWGWHTLCGRAGVDFPHLLWLQARGFAVAPVRTRPGERWVRLSTDLPTAAREILHGRLSARRYARSLLGPLEGAIFARDDPLPGLVEMPLLASTAVRRLAAGKGV